MEVEPGVVQVQVSGRCGQVYVGDVHVERGLAMETAMSELRGRL